MGRRGQYNGALHGIVCPFCGEKYGVTNFSRRDEPEGAEGIDPSPDGPNVGWTAHTVACWRKSQKEPKGDD